MAVSYMNLIIFFLSFVLVSSLGIQLGTQDPFVYENGEKCDVESGCLSLNVTFEDQEGSNSLGSYNETRIDATTSSGAEIVFYIRNFDYFTVYEQRFTDGLSGTTTGNTDGVCTAFPVLKIPNATEAPGLRYVTPGGDMLGWTRYAQASVEETIERFRFGASGGIVGLILPKESTAESVVISALTEPMAANVELVIGEELLLQWGIQGQAESIPPGFSIQFIIVNDEASFNRNVMNWGRLLRTYHETYKVTDFSVDYIGYWTDNGAAYYYNPQPFADFQDMVLGVYSYSMEHEIPIRYVQLDSWWYYKGAGDGLKNWTAIPDVFPAGTEYVHSETGWPISAHNRYFSSDNDYAEQNGGKYPFTIDEDTLKALPLDKSFWDDLFDDAKLWGLMTYEQDWLDVQYDGTNALHTNLTLGSSWLSYMGQSAFERNLTIQYCMSYTRHVLHSVMLPSVTQLRVSADYMLDPSQWRIGITSLFAHALGLKPFKDCFWTSKVNTNVLYYECEHVTPKEPGSDIMYYSYSGRKNVTQTDEPCLYWTSFGFDVKYPVSGMRINLCSIQEQTSGALCYTKASFDTPQSEWEWDFCDPPVCEYECYTFNGTNYAGTTNVTQSGQTCVDWKGEYNISGSYCRNPTNGIAPWCFINDDHSSIDYCDQLKCQEFEEANPELQAAISTLSTGPIGVADRAENLNRDLIMKSVRADGLILKPSKPLTAIDLMFISYDYWETWTSESVVSNFIFGIIFLAEVKESLTLSAFDLNLESAFSTDVILYQNYPNKLSDLQVIQNGDTVQLPSCGSYMQFCILYTSPLFEVNGTRIAVLGELSKWSVISSQRIQEISVEETDIEISVSGVGGELVPLTFWNEAQGQPFSITCNFTSDNLMVISLTSQECM